MNEAVQHRRDAQRAGAAVRLGDVHRPHGRRPVAARAQLGGDGLPVLAQARPEDFDGHPVDPRSTRVGLHRPVGGPQLLAIEQLLQGWFFTLTLWFLRILTHSALFMRPGSAGLLVLAAPARLPDRVHLPSFDEAAGGKRLVGRSRTRFGRLRGPPAKFPELGCLCGSSALRSSGLSPGVHTTMASADSSRHSRAGGLPE